MGKRGCVSELKKIACIPRIERRLAMFLFEVGRCLTHERTRALLKRVEHLKELELSKALSLGHLVIVKVEVALRLGHLVALLDQIDETILEHKVANPSQT